MESFAPMIYSMTTKRAQLRLKAADLGATYLNYSDRKNKKFYVVYDNKTIHFGDTRYEDFTQHQDTIRRDRYLARASAIRNSKGRLTANDPTSPNYWSIRLLWS
jgi:hypothetical protein